jgi:hypothetical protein
VATADLAGVGKVMVRGGCELSAPSPIGRCYLVRQGLRRSFYAVFECFSKKVRAAARGLRVGGALYPSRVGSVTGVLRDANSTTGLYSMCHAHCLFSGLTLGRDRDRDRQRLQRLSTRTVTSVYVFSIFGNISFVPALRKTDLMGYSAFLISIISSETRTERSCGLPQSYVVYSVKVVNGDTSWVCEKRYSDFLILDEVKNLT